MLNIAKHLFLKLIELKYVNKTSNGNILNIEASDVLRRPS